MRFDGKRALVAGTGSGIGAAVARRLTAEGAGVVLAHRDLGAASAVAAELGADAVRLSAA